MTLLEPKEAERHKYKVLSHSAHSCKDSSTIHGKFYRNFIRIRVFERNDQVEVHEIFSFFQRSKNIWSW